MLRSIDFATLLQYSPKGESDAAKKFRLVRDDVKAGRIDHMKERIRERIMEYHALLDPFLNAGVTLIPIPRSSPIRKASLWPSLEIAKMLSGFGRGTIATCLTRQTPVKKAAFCVDAEDRPTVSLHYDSFGVEGMISTNQITLVDDILTQGRTAMAAGSRLAERFPNASIRLFCLLWTRGLDKDVDIDTMLNVQVKKIRYNTANGKCWIKQ
jgi:hypothetical protein